MAGHSGILPKEILRAAQNWAFPPGRKWTHSQSFSHRREPEGSVSHIFGGGSLGRERGLSGCTTPHKTYRSHALFRPAQKNRRGGKSGESDGKDQRTRAGSQGIRHQGVGRGEERGMIALFQSLSNWVCFCGFPRPLTISLRQEASSLRVLHCEGTSRPVLLRIDKRAEPACPAW